MIRPEQSLEAVARDQYPPSQPANRKLLQSDKPVHSPDAHT